MLVQNGLESNRRHRPDKVALVSSGQRLSYAQVDAMADRLAQALVAKGVRRGDRVVIYLSNRIEAVIGIYAALKAAGTFVVVNRSSKFQRLAYILENCQAVAFIAEASLASGGTLGELRAHNQHLKVTVLTDVDAQSLPEDGPGALLSYDSIQREFPDERPRIDTIDLDLASLVYTSGSTGDPKGVMCDHSNVVFAANSVISYLENTDSDIVLNVLPLSFSYGLYQVLMTFTFGGTLVLEDGFAFPFRTLERVAQERVTAFVGVPTIFASLLQMDLSPFDLTSLRYMTNAGAALPVEHIKQLRRRLPHVRFYSMYGLTETKRTLYLPPEELDRRPGSVGIAIPGTEVWIEGPGGRRLGPNEVGELVVRGRHVMRGYWQAPEATRERFRPGPLSGERLCYTGDLFRMDEDGFLYFIGRKDDVIKTRGEKVSPKMVEDVLHTIPGVVEAVVCGVPDPVMGEAVKAVLVADTARLTRKHVFAYCRAHLEDFMVPKLIEFRDQLPKTASGKVQRRALV